MTQVLLDQGMPRSPATFLRASGWDVEHVFDIGLSRASDREIIQHAVNDRRIICTLDADFHALLAVADASGPSVIRVRREGLRARELADMLSFDRAAIVGKGRDEGGDGFTGPQFRQWT